MEEVETYTLEQYPAIIFERFQFFKTLKRVREEKDTVEALEDYCYGVQKRHMDAQKTFVENSSDIDIPFIRTIVTEKAMHQSKELAVYGDYVNAFECLGILSSFDLYCIENMECGFQWKYEIAEDGSEYKIPRTLDCLSAYYNGLHNSLAMLGRNHHLAKRVQFTRADFILRYAILYSLEENFTHEKSVEIYPEHNSYATASSFWSDIASIDTEDYVQGLRQTDLFSNAFLKVFSNARNSVDQDVIDALLRMVQADYFDEEGVMLNKKYL